MKILKFYSGQLNERNVNEAAETLRKGGVIIYPTDTLYALGCDALNNSAIQQLCRLKGIDPERRPLSIVCSSLSQAAEYVRIDNRAFGLIKEYLPGPFTFILPAAKTLPKVFKGRKNVGLRIPDNNVSRAIAEALGNPILSTSVEVDEDCRENATMPEALALRYAHDADLMIDNGEGSLEASTVVDLSDSSAPEIIRQGAGEIEI